MADRLENPSPAASSRARQWCAVNRWTADPFSIFAVLYMTAVIIELSEGWAGSLPGLFSITMVTAVFVVLLLAAVALIATGVTPVKFAAYLIVSSTYILIFQYPDVGNHVNIMLYCNAVMTLTVGYAYSRRRGPLSNDDYFHMIRPALRVGLILVYFFAGFHKLNDDYFNPEVSCGAEIFGYVAATLRTSILGIPVGLSLAAGGLLIVYTLSRRGRFGARDSRVFAALVILIGAGVFSGVVLVATASPASLGSIGMLCGVVVLLWELIGSLLLAVPRLQVAIVPLSLVMHAVLALVGFVDFGTLALPLLFTFVPNAYYQVLTSAARVHLFGLSVDRTHVYFAINFVGAAYTGIYNHVLPIVNNIFVTGMLFIVATIVLLWPMLATLFSPAPPAWVGVAPLSGHMPSFLHVFPVLIVVYALTSYLGLRTAGNFSMFSNVRTEGVSSNHFLMRSNPIKLWRYQEDVVRIIEIDDDAGDVIHHYDRFGSGLELPVVEFRKWIYRWTEAGYEVPLTFGYRDEVRRTANIVEDPVWATDHRSWEMTLLDFRGIQVDGQPNQCRW